MRNGEWGKILLHTHAMEISIAQALVETHFTAGVVAFDLHRLHDDESKVSDIG